MFIHLENYALIIVSCLFIIRIYFIFWLLIYEKSKVKS